MNIKNETKFKNLELKNFFYKLIIFNNIYLM